MKIEKKKKRKKSVEMEMIDWDLGGTNYLKELTLPMPCLVPN